jgi:hypothetical protein
MDEGTVMAVAVVFEFPKDRKGEPKLCPVHNIFR